MKPWLVATAASVAVGLALLRGWGELVPWGANGQPFYLASHEGPSFTSPDGSIELRVFFNDMGAAHSGHHWAWIAGYSRLVGWHVVAEGYTDYEVTRSREPMPIRWLDDRTLEVEFLSARRRAVPVTRVIQLH